MVFLVQLLLCSWVGSKAWRLDLANVIGFSDLMNRYISQIGCLKLGLWLPILVSAFCIPVKLFLAVRRLQLLMLSFSLVSHSTS